MIKIVRKERKLLGECEGKEQRRNLNDFKRKVLWV